MNSKFTAGILIISILLVAGCTQNTINVTTPAPAQNTTVSPSAPSAKEFNITMQRFSFSPSTITVNNGDQVRFNVMSTDVTHGFSIQAYSINEIANPGEVKTITFTANQPGQFTYSCSVFCGSGHSQMRGTFIVNP